MQIKSRRMRWVIHVACMGEDFGGKSQRKVTTWKIKAEMGGWDQN
jgi:hypothetical protein